MDDERIIELFFARSEQAIGELDIKYGKLCHNLSHNILGNRSDAEECVNDAYLGAWNAIPPAKPNPLQAYICKIVRNISLKLYYRKEAAKRSSSYTVAMKELEASLSSPDTVETRVIFMLRYAYSEPYAEIAKRVGLTENNVAVRLNRTRKKMKMYLIEREVFV